MFTLPENTDIVITVSDAREIGGCVNGWKMFVESHGYVWKDVVKNGLTATQLLATEDAMAEKLVEYVYNRNRINNV